MMISSEYFIRIRSTLWKLGIDTVPSLSIEVSDYLLKYGGTRGVLWVDDAADLDEYEPSEEEHVVLMELDSAYADQAIDNMLLGDNDET